MTERAIPVDLDWNIVVTCRQGGQRTVRRALHPLTRLRRSGFRNVLLGRAEIESFLAGVAELLERRRGLAATLGTVVAVERTFAIDLLHFDEQLAAEAALFVDRLAGQSFHVRVERRGHKGVINTQRTEKALGDALYAALEARGLTPRITFSDPDAIIAVEVIGDAVGLGFVTRAQRSGYPFIRID